MSFPRNVVKNFAILLLQILLSSCQDEAGCVSADQFDTESTTVQSNPLSDGVYGTYDALNGGQKAEWHDTGLKSDGSKIYATIGGSWTPWMGTTMSNNALGVLQKCNFCSKTANAPNCICGKNAIPTAEAYSQSGIANSGVNCSGADKNDPNKCTCTNDVTYRPTADAITSVDNVYHFPLNFFDKSENVLIADRQTTCKYSQGMGLYIGMFGTQGAENPIRLYHMFSENAVCDVPWGANGDCKDSSGNDITRYAFVSKNRTIFVQNDNAGNFGTDGNPSDDAMHQPGEVIKVVIYDKYYSDNYGQYDIQFLGGFAKAQDPGLLEYMVRSFEDIVLGPKSTTDYGRDGGIMKSLYEGIVKDTGFALFLQIALGMYIMFYGAAVVMGIAEANKKELTSRVLKIGLIIFFISPDSWFWYNKMIVNFFKDGMDYIVGSIMTFSDMNLDASSTILTAQADRAADISNSTRFSYVDTVIKKLFSSATTKKIWGLFFGTGFGILYIPIIYLLIVAFIYVMLYAASVYIINVMKIVFVLAIGPFFICFTLFSHTNDMFKKWIGFLGARSLEVIFLFLVLYNFLVIIDKNFTDMLSYRSCVNSHSFGLFSVKILQSEIGRSLPQWINIFITIAGLLFITYMILQKVGSLSESLISIGGQKSGGSSSFGLASNMMFQAAQISGGALSKGLDGAGVLGGYAAVGLTKFARATGIADAWNKMGDAIPFRGPRTYLRDSIIDQAIKTAKSEGAAKGLSGKDLDTFTRNRAKNLVMSGDGKEGSQSIFTNKAKFRMLGIDTKAITERLDYKLVQKPLKKFLSDEAKKMKNQDPSKILLGDKMISELSDRAKAWADNNLVNGKSSIEGHLGNMKEFMRQEGTLSSAEAAKAFGSNQKLKNQYLQHLEEQRLRRKDMGFLGKIKGEIARDAASNPKMAAKNFINASNDKTAEDRVRKSWDNRAGRDNENFLQRNWRDMVGFMDAKRTFAPGDRDQRRVNTRQARRDALLESLKDHNLSGDKRRFFSSQLQQIAIKSDPELRDLVKHVNKFQKSGQAGRATAMADDAINEYFKSIKLDDGSTVLERVGKVSYLQEQFKGIASAENTDQDAQLVIAKIMKDEVDAKIPDVGIIGPQVVPDTSPQELKDIKDVQSQGFMATEFKVQMGDLSAAMLQTSNLGLSDGIPLLGAKQACEAKGKDFEKVRDLEMRKAQISSQLKIAKYELKIKEQELKRLEALDPQHLTAKEKSEIDSLRKETSSISDNIDRYERDVASVESDLTST